jgi:hypothetical protein
MVFYILEQYHYSNPKFVCQYAFCQFCRESDNCRDESKASGDSIWQLVETGGGDHLLEYNYQWQERVLI